MLAEADTIRAAEAKAKKATVTPAPTCSKGRMTVAEANDKAMKAGPTNARGVLRAVGTETGRPDRLQLEDMEQNPVLCGGAKEETGWQAEEAGISENGKPDRWAREIAYSESEGARLIGLHPWNLRGERLRGRIKASRIVGRRIRYLRSDLIEYLTRHRIGSE